MTPAAEMVSIALLRPWQDNPRHNDGRPVEAVADSIRRFGFGAPLLVRLANNEIIAGHTRLKAAVQLGLTEVPVRYMDLTEGEARALALADNRVSELAEWDVPALSAVLADLRSAGTDIGGLGWDAGSLDGLLSRPGAPAPGDNDAPQGPREVFQVLVTCENEDQQSALLMRLHSEGFQTRSIIG